MLAAQLINRPRIGLASLLDDNFGVKLSKESQKANWSKRPITPKLLNYAALDVWHLPALRDILKRELKKLGRLDWLEQQCRAQIAAGSEGFAPPTENDWRIGRSERFRAPGLSVLHAVWHWREAQAQRIDTPPFKVCGNALLLKIAEAAEAGETEAGILNTVHLGKRHERIFPSLAAAVRAGLARDPKTLPRRPGRDPNYVSLTQAEIELQDRIRTDRDRIAKKLGIGKPHESPHGWTIVGVIAFQFLVGIYGGYFGAGIGILMLSGLGMLGLTDIHQMNALKGILGTCINGVSVVVFILEGMVEWRYAVPMAVTAIIGGYVGARLAQRVPRSAVRWLVVCIGFGLAGYYFAKQAGMLG
jgi:hypothetical protein